MDEYQIPTIDGRHITLRYDQATGQTVLTLPTGEDLSPDDGNPPGVGLTVDNADAFVDALTALRNRAAEDASQP